MNATDDFADRYFTGRALYGDDFDQPAIDAWFADEEHGYADLSGADRSRHEYGYDELNRRHGYDCLPPTRRFRHALGFGSNFGDELAPVLDRLDRITLLDSSDRYRVRELKGVPVDFLIANATGEIGLADGSVDLITCFGVLHHIPNVSKVLDEFRRVLAVGGFALIREPATSMGDWRHPRRGLTARERGIPRRLLIDMVSKAGLKLVHAGDCQFSPLNKLCQKLGANMFNSRPLVQLDSLLSRAFLFNQTYHRTSTWSRFAPAGLFVVAAH